MSRIFTICLIFVIFVVEMTKSEDELINMFVKRCDEKLPKEKSQAYDKCDSEATDDLKETVKKCGKEICNKDGKFHKLDVCCYAVKPKQMFECFEKTITEVEANDAKTKGVTKDELQKKNLRTAAKIVECYDQIDDNNGDD